MEERSTNYSMIMISFRPAKPVGLWALLSSVWMGLTQSLKLALMYLHACCHCRSRPPRTFAAILDKAAVKTQQTQVLMMLSFPFGRGLYCHKLKWITASKKRLPDDFYNVPALIYDKSKTVEIFYMELFLLQKYLWIVGYNFPKGFVS